MLLFGMNKKALQAFVDIGLKPYEAAVYAACLGSPKGLFVNQITRISSIKRSTVDIILLRLKKKGFVSWYKEGKRTTYVAEPPDKLLNSLAHKVDNFKLLLPTLLKAVGEGEGPKVRFYEGLEGVQKIYEDILLSCISSDEAKEICTISSGRELFRALPDHDKHFIRKRIRRRIPIRILAPSDPQSRKRFMASRETLRETRFFNSKAYPIQGEINIYADKIAFMTFDADNMAGAVLESKLMSSDMRSLFNWLWHAAPKHNGKKFGPSGHQIDALSK